MNMTERDWEIVLAEQREAFEALCSKKERYDTKNIVVTVNGEECEPLTVRTTNQLFNYIRIEKSTAKAKFYVTHETLSEIHGFWCPNAAATMRETDVVEVAHWCKIKIINFV